MLSVLYGLPRPLGVDGKLTAYLTQVAGYPTPWRVKGLGGGLAAGQVHMDISPALKQKWMKRIFSETQTVIHQEYQSSGTCHLTVNTLVTSSSMTNLTVTICPVKVF